MRLPQGSELDASADYEFVVEDGRLTLLFPTSPPRLFQAFALHQEEGALIGDSRHDCPPDTYLSRIAFLAGGDWTLTHAVSGPRKGYVSATRYGRGAAARR